MTDSSESFLGVEEKTENSSLNQSSSVGSTLSIWGNVFLWFGALIAIGCVIASGLVTKKYSVDTWGENGFSWVYISFAIGAFVQGLIVKLFLDGFSEIIRLLNKKQF